MNNDWLIWLIFSLLLATLVGFILFTFIRDRMKKRKIAYKRYELKIATAKTKKQICIKIKAIIDINNEFVKQVKPGQSTIRMKYVNLASKENLKHIYNSKTFKTIYLDEEEKDKEFPKMIKNLIDVKSNLWHKECKEELEYFQNIANKAKEENKQEYEDYYNNVKEEIKSIFVKWTKSNESDQEVLAQIVNEINKEDQNNKQN